MDSKPRLWKKQEWASWYEHNVTDDKFTDSLLLFTMTITDWLHEDKTIISSLSFYFSTFRLSIYLTTRVIFWKGYIMISTINMHLSFIQNARKYDILIFFLDEKFSSILISIMDVQLRKTLVNFMKLFNPSLQNSFDTWIFKNLQCWRL